MGSILNMVAPIVIWIIDKIIRNDTKKKEAKKRYYDYVDYWKKNRVTPKKHGDDLRDIVEGKEDSE